MLRKFNPRKKPVAKAWRAWKKARTDLVQANSEITFWNVSTKAQLRRLGVPSAGVDSSSAARKRVD